MVRVIALGSEEEPAELASVEAAPLARVDLGPSGILRGVRWDPAVDVGEAVEPADRRQPSVDGRSREAPLFHGARPQLDVASSGLEHLEADVGTPLEERAQVAAVSLKGPTAVAGQVRDSGHLDLGERSGVMSAHQRFGTWNCVRHGFLLVSRKTANTYATVTAPGAPQAGGRGAPCPTRVTIWRSRSPNVAEWSRDPPSRPRQTFDTAEWLTHWRQPNKWPTSH